MQTIEKMSILTHKKCILRLLRDADFKKKKKSLPDFTLTRIKKFKSLITHCWQHCREIRYPHTSLVEPWIGTMLIRNKLPVFIIMQLACILWFRNFTSRNSSYITLVQLCVLELVWMMDVHEYALSYCLWEPKITNHQMLANIHSLPQRSGQFRERNPMFTKDIISKKTNCWQHHRVCYHYCKMAIVIIII